MVIMWCNGNWVHHFSNHWQSITVLAFTASLWNYLLVRRQQYCQEPMWRWRQVLIKTLIHHLNACLRVFVTFLTVSLPYHLYGIDPLPPLYLDELFSETYYILFLSSHLLTHNFVFLVIFHTLNWNILHNHMCTYIWTYKP